MIHWVMGDRDLALERFAESISQRSPYTVWLKTEPAFESLRADGRIQALIGSKADRE